jgi:dTDP-4-amino-4,6-dideoxygalactose transaminase
MERISLTHASLGERELAAVAEVFASGWPAGHGPRGKALEAQLAEKYGVEDAVAVSSCGAALHLAMLAFDVKKGDEVIVADYSFPAPALAALYVGATPVFADVRPDTYTIDPQSVESLITPRTVGIIAVDTVGMPADYTELQAIADRHGLFLIEDAACSVGATYQGRQAGELAEVACLSFHGRKGASSGEGGALIARDPAICKDARLRSAFGVSGNIFDLGNIKGLVVPSIIELGYNFKLSDIAAAILQVQLSRIDELLERRNAVATQYAEMLGDEELLTVPTVPQDRTHAWQTYMLTLDARVDRGAVAAELRGQGIGCGIGTFAAHAQPLFQGQAQQKCPVSADLFERQLSLPMHAELKQSQVERVVDVVRNAVRTHAAAAGSVGGAA